MAPARSAGRTAHGSPLQLARATDEQLARQAAQGSQEAWAVLYERCATFLHRYGLKLGREPESVQDLVQETMIRAWNARTRYRPTHAYRSWILTIFHRLLASQCRRERTHRSTMDHSVQRGGADAWWLGTDTDPRVLMEAFEARERLAPVLEQLTPTERQLLLAWAAGDNQAEIARQRRVHPVTLRTQLRRAKQRLVAAYLALYPYETVRPRRTAAASVAVGGGGPAAVLAAHRAQAG